MRSLQQAANLAGAGGPGSAECHYTVAGLPVRITFGGPAHVQRLVSAMSHIRRARTGPTSLSVDVWSGPPMPNGPWRGLMAPGQPPARGFDPHGTWFLGFDGALTACAPRRGWGCYWRDDAGREPWAERVAPLSPLFGAWLSEHNRQLVHAGAVGSERGCVLLVGPSGSGKSYTALACAEAGSGYLGDDTCVLEGVDPPLVHSVYRSAQLTRTTLRRLPALASSVGDAPRLGKAVLFLDDHLVAHAPLRAVAIVASTGSSETRVRPASAAQALAALGPSSVFAVPGAGEVMLRQLARAVGAVPAVHLEAGSDPAGVARAVERLLV